MKSKKKPLKLSWKNDALFAEYYQSQFKTIFSKLFINLKFGCVRFTWSVELFIRLLEFSIPLT